MADQRPKSAVAFADPRAVVDALSESKVPVDDRTLAAELAKAANGFLRAGTAEGRTSQEARQRLHDAAARFQARALDGKSELLRAVTRALYQLRSLSHALPPEAKLILRELAEVQQRLDPR